MRSLWIVITLHCFDSRGTFRFVRSMLCENKWCAFRVRQPICTANTSVRRRVATISIDALLFGFAFGNRYFPNEASGFIAQQRWSNPSNNTTRAFSFFAAYKVFFALVVVQIGLGNVRVRALSLLIHQTRRKLNIHNSRGAEGTLNGLSLFSLSTFNENNCINVKLLFSPHSCAVYTSKSIPASAAYVRSNQKWASLLRLIFNGLTDGFFVAPQQQYVYLLSRSPMLDFLNGLRRVRDGFFSRSCSITFAAPPSVLT